MGRRAYFIDWVVLVLALLLLCLGLATLLSIQTSLFYQQLVFAVIGIVLFYLFSKIDFEMYQYLDKFIYAGCLVFLLMTFLGPNIRGATRWLEIAGVRLQPSEMIKPFLLVSFANMMAKYSMEKFKSVILMLGLFLPPFLLVFKQPDLGNAVVYFLMWASMLYTSGLGIVYLFTGVFILLISIPLAQGLLQVYQKNRLVTFFNPLVDPQGVGYNAIQSMIAVGAGGLFGRGFGRGTQSLLKFLPERHTDFIFASYTEEFGFVGAFILLVIFGLLFWRLLKMAQKYRDRPVVYIYISGLFMQMFIQLVVNIGMNMGILPITGITLPFISLGGSSLLATFIGLGIYNSALQQPRSSRS